MAPHSPRPARRDDAPRCRKEHRGAQRLGFDGPDWSIPHLEANLDRDAYVTIGKMVRAILEEYHEEYLAFQKEIKYLNLS